MPGPWLRHPARTIRPPTSCPTGQPRFRTADLARQSVPIWVTTRFDTVRCGQCRGGVHLVEAEA